MEPYRSIRQSSAQYPVYVGAGLLDGAGQIVTATVGPARRPFVLTPSSLVQRFGHRVSASFHPPARVVTFEDGEARKTLATAEGIVTHLLELGAQRDAVAVIVGGGMAGDTAGFAASIFLRGIDVVHIPTTLLAQVDSSIGGKVAVNHPSGKNLIGSFHPPRAVIADTLALESLPWPEFLSGLFEALKGGVIGDRNLFELIDGRRDAVASRDRSTVGEIVRRAIDVKGDIVAADEKETDLRRLLNYGHTIGHGIEAAMRYQGITHGEAVAWGMIAANAIAVRRGVLENATRGRIDEAVRAWKPASLPALDRAEVLHAIAHDKKFTEDRRVMVLARAIGKCQVVTDIETAEIEYGIEAVLG
jgi:3-dehydroquinate synthase